MNVIHTQLVLVPVLATLTAAATAQTVTQIIDATGDGAGNPLSLALDVALDGFGNVYVVGSNSDNVFKISPHGLITEIINATGGVDTSGDYVQVLAAPSCVAADDFGNVYVAGEVSDNVFMITPGGSVTEILDAMGDGAENKLDGPADIATDGSGNVYVAGAESNNVFKITPGGAITAIIDASGDGTGNMLDGPTDVAVDKLGNVYVVGVLSGHAFRIAPGGTITKIFDLEVGSFLNNGAIAVSDSGNVYIGNSWNEGWWLFGTVFMITPGGMITEIFGGYTTGLAVDGAENVYVTHPCQGYACLSGAFKITPDGETTVILDSDGDGVNYFGYPWGIAAHGSGTVYVTSTSSDNAFKIAATCPTDGDGDGTVGITDFLALLEAWGPNPVHPADLDGDGTVGISDLLALIATWGPCP